MNRRYSKWLIIVIALSIIAVSSIILINLKFNYFSLGHGNSMMDGTKSLTSNSLKEKMVENSNKLPIPELLENKSLYPNSADYTLNAEKGFTSFFPGVKTETYGYKGNFLGPVIGYMFILNI